MSRKIIKQTCTCDGKGWIYSYSQNEYEDSEGNKSLGEKNYYAQGCNCCGGSGYDYSCKDGKTVDFKKVKKGRGITKYDIEVLDVVCSWCGGSGCKYCFDTGKNCSVRNVGYDL